MIAGMIDSNDGIKNHFLKHVTRNGSLSVSVDDIT